MEYESLNHYLVFPPLSVSIVFVYHTGYSEKHATVSNKHHYGMTDSPKLGRGGHEAMKKINS
jgi:hypothetical protein